MKFYIAFALNLIALTFNVARLVYDPRPSILSLVGAALGAIGVRIMFPIVVAHLREK